MAPEAKLRLDTWDCATLFARTAVLVAAPRSIKPFCVTPTSLTVKATLFASALSLSLPGTTLPVVLSNHKSAVTVLESTSTFNRVSN